MPLISTAESPRRGGLGGLANGDVAVFQREVVVQRHVEVFELRDLRAGVAFLRFRRIRTGQIDAALQEIQIAGGGLGLGQFHVALHELDVALGGRAVLVGPDHRAGQSGVGLAQLDLAGQHVVAGFLVAADAALGGHAFDLLGLELPIGPVLVAVEFAAEDHVVNVGRRNAKDLGGLGGVVVLLRHEGYLCSNCKRISRGRGFSPLKSVIIKSKRMLRTLRRVILPVPASIQYTPIVC